MPTDVLIENLLAALAEEEGQAEFHRQKADFHQSRAEQMKAFLTQLQMSVNETDATSSQRMGTSGPRVGPAEAVRLLFETEPSKVWAPMELHRVLTQMRNEGRLASKAVELLASIHTIIKRLKEKGDIEPREKDGVKGYISVCKSKT